MTLNETPSYYDILDISSDASPQEVRDAYIRIKATYNRDSVALYSMVDTEERESTLNTIEEAYAVLSNPEKRRVYDQNFGFLNNAENPFAREEDKAPPSNVISIDRVPPMENLPEGDQFLIPPITDFNPPLRPHAIVNETPEPTPPQPPTPPSIVVHKLEISDPAPSKPAGGRTDTRLLTPELDTALVEAVEMETEWKGNFIKRIREAYRISIEEMSAITKVSKTYVIAIEEDNYSKLPAPVYVRGFVSQIAKVLKLPNDRVANAYLARMVRRKT